MLLIDFSSIYWDLWWLNQLLLAKWRLFSCILSKKTCLSVSWILRLALKDASLPESWILRLALEFLLGRWFKSPLYLWMPLVVQITYCLLIILDLKVLGSRQRQKMLFFFTPLLCSDNLWLYNFKTIVWEQASCVGFVCLK